MARGRQSSLRLALSPEAHQTWERWQRPPTMAAGRARRGNIILWLVAGSSQSDVAPAVGVQRAVVRTWAKRFLAERLDGLAAAPGRGAKGDFPPGGRQPPRAAGRRAPGCTGPPPVPVGWPGTGPPAHHGGHRCGDLRRHGAADAGLPSPPALASSSLALAQAPPGRGLLGHDCRAHRPLPASSPCRGARPVRGGEHLPAAASSSLADAARTPRDHAEPR